ncbi:hypothetical protein PUR61_00180, partial [Streptomyces sp. BE20]|nr:hypothetical protein [Streptomyces sp. BE20]
LETRQSELGVRAAALSSATEAVVLFIELADTGPSPDAFLIKLADALCTLSAHQADNGDRSAALATATEAVPICRHLADTDPAASLPHLAGALDNLGIHQSGAGDDTAARA